MSEVASFAAVLAGEGEVSVIEGAAVVRAIEANKATIVNGSNNRDGGGICIRNRIKEAALLCKDGLRTMVISVDAAQMI